MKLIVRHTDHVYKIFIPCTLAGFLLVLFVNVHLAQVFYTHWGFLIAALAFVLLPVGNIRITDNKLTPNKYHWRKWLLLLWGMQAALYLIFFSIHFLVTQGLTVVTPYNTPSFVDSLGITILNWGLFPWAFYGVCAVNFGYWCYCRGEKGVFSHFMWPILKNSEQGKMGTALDFITRLVLFFCHFSHFFLSICN